MGCQPLVSKVRFQNTRSILYARADGLREIVSGFWSFGERMGIELDGNIIPMDKCSVQLLFWCLQEGFPLPWTAAFGQRPPAKCGWHAQLTVATTCCCYFSGFLVTTAWVAQTRTTRRFDPDSAQSLILLSAGVCSGQLCQYNNQINNWNINSRLQWRSACKWSVLVLQTTMPLAPI